MSVDINIINTLIENMIIAQNDRVQDKKEFVMSTMRCILSKESYERYAPFISVLIDTLKTLSKTKILQNLKNKKCSCLNI